RLYGKGKIYHALKLLSTPAVKGFSHKVISALIRFAQDGVELMNYSLRQRLLEYDDVLSLHANIVYAYRDRFLSSENIVEYIKMLEDEDPDLFDGLSDRYNEKVLSEGVWFQIEERLVFINQLDYLWIQHIEDLERLWEGMGLRAIGARPGLLAEFKKEAFRLFQGFMLEFKNTIFQQLLKE
ncbi:MAG: hypothetical protein Q8Q33_07515, partial [Chlamydiota bacterium]|nr:hypothetical protein [Chlamydiota bacterium]